jgi:hypothetical protein
MKKKEVVDDKLIEYVVNNFINKFNKKEKYLYNLFILNNTLKKIDNDFQKEELLKKMKFKKTDLEITRLLDYQSFLYKTVLRIINEENIFLNRCPICGTIARTPIAKIGRCGHIWKGDKGDH